MRWYSIKTHINKEKFISDKIRTDFYNKKINCEVLLPINKIFIRRGEKKISREKLIYPCYVFVKTENVEDLEDTLRLISGHNGIMKNRDGAYSCLSEDEANKIIAGQEKEQEKDVNDYFTYKVNEKVLITSGPFSKFKGNVIEVTKNKIVVSVPVFGRQTLVDLEVNQVEKIIEY